MLGAASNLAGKVDSVFLFILSVAVFFLVLITVLMVYFVIKYNRKRNIPPANIEGHKGLEVVWTVVPTVLVLAMFFYGWSGFRAMRAVPREAMVVEVTGQMWSWSFKYPNGRETDVLKLPVGKPVKLALTSRDVIHSFFVPAFRVKEDAVPGMTNYLWFTPTKVGTYDALCAEYCGLRHSYMLARVEVVPRDEFLAWYEADGAPRLVRAEPQGLVLLKTKGCLACHTTDGSPLVGPTFKGLFRRQSRVVTAGKEREVVADEEYIRRSILDPQADLVKGFPPIMPPQKGLLSEEELEEIVSYLKTLR